jgi:two-component system CheB/CheR fusion protein
MGKINKKGGLRAVPKAGSAEADKAIKTKTIAAKVNVAGMKDFPIVGIGASAGGLETLEQFFRNFPADVGFGFVIIQHLDPKHPSMMASLLQRHTKMPIMEIEDSMAVKANYIYLNPPNSEVVISGRRLHLSKPEQPVHGLRLPIDHFFRSLAEDLHERAIAIVLSGTGSDGSLGIKAIKGEGGITLAQEASQAKYGGMPQSAIDTGFVDVVLPVEKMAEELIKYAGHPYISKTEKELSESERFSRAANSIFTIIRKSTGFDFTNYKSNTIRRRIERRMALHKIKAAEDYVKFLSSNPKEVDLLYKDLLIKVTNFFRDPDAFKVLEREVIPEIIEKTRPGSSIRVWVPACATGEEAYSIAILFDEAMGRLKKSFEIHIFATDMDSDAINFARIGEYPSNIAADVTQERLDRYFTKTDTGYKVKKSLRDTVLFATQNIVKDPPFSKLDLLSCRNMLIYMDGTLQKRLFPIFHYALNPSGYLFLGSSESVGEFVDRFSAVNMKWKIFKRKGAAAGRPVEFQQAEAFQFAGKAEKAQETEHKEMNIRRMAETIILENYAPTCVLIDARYDILYVNGRTEQFLSLPSGQPTYNILKMAKDDIRAKLTNALHKAFKQKKPVLCESVPVRDNGISTVDIIVRPLAGYVNLPETAMVIFESKKSAGGKAGKSKAKAEGLKLSAKGTEQIRELEQELASTKEYLQTITEELETSNEELKSTNEELQSSNEELQSTNEELETSREELQSTNEELETVNSELQSKIAEMTKANNEVTNLLNSMDVAMLLLDNALNIKRFTNKTKELFNLIPTDMGRSIEDIAHKIKKPGIFADIRDVLTNLKTIEKETETADGRWYLTRMRPYQTSENVIEGALVTFVDVTGRREAEAAASSADVAKGFAESIIATMREPLMVLDEELRVIMANESFHRFFHLKEKDIAGKFVYEIGSGQWDIASLRQALEEILPQNNKFENFEISLDIGAKGRKKLLLNARQIFRDRKGTQQILLAFEDAAGKS